MRLCTLSCVCLLSTLPGILAAQSVRGFGPQEGENSLPRFGVVAEGLPALTDADRSNADSAIRKVDTNKDGQMGREELRKSKYAKYETKRFYYDLDRNDRLTTNELGYYYAEIRVAKETKAKREATAKIKAATEAQAKAQQAAAAAQAQQQAQALGFVLNNGNNNNITWGNHIHVVNSKAQVIHLGNGMQGYVVNGNVVYTAQQQVNQAAAQQLLQRYDKNSDGNLDRHELKLVEGALVTADSNHDGRVALSELMMWLGTDQNSKRSSPAAEWFTRRDVDHDGLVTMPEYADEWTDALVLEFEALDRDHDDVISAAESLASTPTTGKEYVSSSSMVIERGGSVSSAIFVPDDFEVGDVNVRMTVTHRVPAELDLELVAPSGKRVRLLSGTGKKWKGRDLIGTTFDDEATTSITSAAPPFRGTFKPEGVGPNEKEPLSAYDGELSKGEWRLVVQASRSYRAGLLGKWSIVLHPSTRDDDRVN